MPISQSHILMLAAVSIFTGIIAPGVANEEIFRPYALTNMQYVAYGILALLALLFFCANFHMRRISMGLTFALIILILSLAMMSVAGVVQSFSGVVLQGFAWGWIFLAMGLLLLFLSLRGKYETSTDEITTLSEKILGIVGLSILLILTAFVVTIAEMNSRKQENTTTIAKMLDPSLVASASGVTLSVPFQHIDHFFLDRKRDMLSFIGTDSTGKSILYPGNIRINDRQNIESTRFLQGRKFIIQKDGSILENGDIIGLLHAGVQDKNILFYQHPEGKYILLTDHSSTEYHLDETDIDLLYYQEKHQDLYWRSTTSE